MKTIGDHTTARLLYKHFENLSVTKAPKGFSHIGGGCYRAAYLHRASGVVYKIGDWESNSNEAYTARRLRKRSTRSLGFELLIPHTRTYVMGRSDYGPINVVAQEHAANSSYTHCDADYNWRDGKCDCKHKPCFSEVRTRIAEFTGLNDMHGENVLIDKLDRFWLIDLGC